MDSLTEQSGEKFEDPYVAMEAMRSTRPIDARGLGAKKRSRGTEATPPTPEAKAASARSRRRGKDGEREAVAIWRSHGYANARRTPGSGAWQPNAPGNAPPFPGDLMGVEPFLVEVKHTKYSDLPGRSWPGAAFIRTVCIHLDSVWRQTMVRGALPRIPVIMCRVQGQARVFRFFVPAYVFLGRVGVPSPHAFFEKMSDVRAPFDWVELDEQTFFDLMVYGGGHGDT